MDEVIKFFTETPAPPALWFSVLASSALLIWNIFAYIQDKSEAKKLRASIKRDDFWFRTIVLPNIVKPILSFSEKNSKKIIKLNNMEYCSAEARRKAYNGYFEEFNKGREMLIQRCYILTLHDRALYDKVSNHIDELEDIVTFYCFSKVNPQSTLLNGWKDNIKRIDTIFFTTSTKILEEIKIFHESNEL